jgi:hypothetical protein
MVNGTASPHVVVTMTLMMRRLCSLHEMVRCDISRMSLAMLLAASALLGGIPTAMADDELPARVGRVADVGGELFLASQDAPDQWVPIGLNYPVTTGDNLWAGNDSRVEVDFGGGQFRLSGNTSVQVSRLDDGNLTLFVAQGRTIVRIRALDPGETARIDVAGAQIALTRPGLYRIEVSEDQQYAQLAVREGAADIDNGAAVVTVLPGQSATLDGPAPAYALLRNGIASDGFDTWSANRDRYYERGSSNSSVSKQMVGYADLDQYGAWDSVPDYGAVWYPANVANDWAPYRDGYWTDVGAWGPTWVDYAPWGYAPFHYGRWVHLHGRWGWCPGAYVRRPVWAPALVGWVGGPGWRSSSGRGGPVYGWVPLGWGEAYHPHWRGCTEGCWTRYNKPYAVSPSTRQGGLPARYANWNVQGAVSAVSGSALARRQPVRSNLVAIDGTALNGAPVLAAPPARVAIRQDVGRKPGNGAPLPAAVYNVPATRPSRIAAPGAPAAAQTPVQPVAQPTSVAQPSRGTAPTAMQVPVPPAVKRAPTPVNPQASTYTFPAQQPAPISVTPPSGTAAVPIPAPRGDANARMQPMPQPVAAPAGVPANSSNLPAVAPPRPVGVRERAPVTPSLGPVPSTFALPSHPAAAPVPAMPTVVVPARAGPATPAPSAAPGAPVNAPQGGHPRESPNAEKPAPPVVRAPGEVPQK